MQRIARIPLVRTRRRRPKPPLYWVLAFLLAQYVLFTGLQTLKLLDNPTPSRALALAHDVLWAFLLRYGMRVADPEDTPARYLTTATVSAFLAVVALDVTRWSLFGFLG